MTLAEIITESQSLTRQNDGISNATYISWLNRINRAYCRREQWPQMRVLNAVLTTVLNQAAYDLPTNYNRLAGQFVLWDAQAITGGYTGGFQVPYLNQGTLELDNRTLGFTNLGAGIGGCPASVAVQQKLSSTLLQMVFSPIPGTAGLTVLYNYYKDPAAFTATSDSIPIANLGDTFTMALCKNIAAYLDNADLALMYAQMERREYNAALAVLNAQ